MSQENGSEASENPNRFSGKRDRADAEDMVPFKKRVRFLSDDLMEEVTDDKTERSGANYNDVKVFTASGLTDAGKGNKAEIIPTQERSTCITCNDADISASPSQLALRESGFGAGNEPRGDGGEKHEKESQELMEYGGGGGSCSQTGHGTTVPPTSGGQNVETDRLPKVQEAAMNDGSDGSSGGGEEKSKGDLFYRRRRAKQSRSPEEDQPLQDQSAPDQGEGDFSGDGLDAEGGTKGGDDGGGAFSPTDTGFESGGDRSSTEDERHEEVQITATEVGEMSDDVGECKEDENFSGDAPDAVGDEEHIPKAEGHTKNEDGGEEWSPIRPPVECEAAVKDGILAASGEESSKGNNKLVEVDDESEMIDDGDASGKDEKVTEGGGDGSVSAINIIIESNNGGNGEGDHEEQGKHAAIMEDDNYALGDGKQAQEPEPVTKHGGSSSRSYADATAGSEAGDHHHEQQQLAAIMEYGGNENIGNIEPDMEEKGDEDKELPVEADHHGQGQLAAIMEDGGNENMTNSEPEREEQGNKGKEQVEADEHEQGQLVAMEDGGNNGNIRNSEAEGVEEKSNKGKEPMEADHHEQATEDDGDPNAAVVLSGEELGDKKGKKPVEYVGSRNKSNRIAPGVVGDEEQTAEGDHTYFVPLFHVFGDPDDEIEDMPIQGDMQTQQDPMAVEYIRKRARSIHEQGEEGDAGGDTPGEEARKKRKHGSDDVGGSTSALVAYGEPPMQVANHTFTLFGVPIPREQEPDDDDDDDDAAINTNLVLEISDSDHGAGGEFADGSPPTQQPADGVEVYDDGVNMAEEQVQPVARRGIQLFGVYITQEQEQAVEMQNGDQENSHGGGESSMQRPRSGLRLFGFDII